MTQLRPIRGAGSLHQRKSEQTKAGVGVLGVCPRWRDHVMFFNGTKETFTSREGKTIRRRRSAPVCVVRPIVSRPRRPVPSEPRHVCCKLSQGDWGFVLGRVGLFLVKTLKTILEVLDVLLDWIVPTTVLYCGTRKARRARTMR